MQELPMTCLQLGILIVNVDCVACMFDGYSGRMFKTGVDTRNNSKGLFCFCCKRSAICANTPASCGQSS